MHISVLQFSNFTGITTVFMEERKDLLTGEIFIPKRVTQQFKSPRNRIAYHNDKARWVRSDRAAVDKPLHTNYWVLSRLLGSKKEATYHKEFLRGSGVNF